MISNFDRVEQLCKAYLDGERFMKVDNLMEYFYDDILNLPASIKHHHTENGGWIRHVAEVMDYALKITYGDESSLIFLAFIHDLDKLERYKWNGKEYVYANRLVTDDSASVLRICSNFGLKLTEAEVHALCCHHGGWSDSGKRGSLSPLATILHCADLMSAKIKGDVNELPKD